MVHWFQFGQSQSSSGVVLVKVYRKFEHARTRLPGQKRRRYSILGTGAEGAEEFGPPLSLGRVAFGAFGMVR